MAVDINAIKDRGKDRGLQRTKLPVYEFYAGSGNHTETFPYAMRELVFSNDSAGTINFQVIGPYSLNITFQVLAGDVVDERFSEFTSVVVTGSGAWRFYPRTGLIE